jgi:hypothetical protein
MRRRTKTTEDDRAFGIGARGTLRVWQARDRQCCRRSAELPVACYMATAAPRPGGDVGGREHLFPIPSRIFFAIRAFLVP